MKNNQQQKNIPSGWPQVKLGYISHIFSGGTPDTNNQDFWNGDINWITPTEITKTGKYIILKTKKKITNLGLKNSSAKLLPKGSLVVCTRATVGECSISTYPITTNQGFKNLIPKKNTTVDYLYYFVKSIKPKLVSLGSGSTFLEVSKKDIEKLKFLLPPLPEQTRIVSVLETWDKYIENLNKKIEIKKQIKKGLMQDLLTGKKRLSGFNNDWKELKIDKLGKTYPGITGKNKDDFGKGKPFISYMNIYSNPELNTNIKTFVDIFDGERQNKVKYGDIFFTTSSETPDEVGISSVLLNREFTDLYLNSFCFGFRLNDFKTIIPEFTRFYFRGQDFRKEMTRIAQGASRFNLSKKYFLETKIKIPIIDEQKAIANILTTADKEISELENKLGIIKDQKKYLLNNLITGTIRTKEDMRIIN